MEFELPARGRAPPAGALFDSDDLDRINRTFGPEFEKAAWSVTQGGGEFGMCMMIDSVDPRRRGRPPTTSIFLGRLSTPGQNRHSFPKRYPVVRISSAGGGFFPGRLIPGASSDFARMGRRQTAAVSDRCPTTTPELLLILVLMLGDYRLTVAGVCLRDRT